MAKNSKKQGYADRRPVICLNCGHEFISKVRNPQCGRCKKRKVVDVRKAGKKEVQFLGLELKRLREEVESSQKKVEKDLRGVGYDMQSLYRYIRQIVQVLEENGLTPSKRGT